MEEPIIEQDLKTGALTEVNLPEDVPQLSDDKITAFSDEEKEEQARKARNAKIAKGLGILAVVGTSVAGSLKKKKSSGKLRMSHASAPSGGSSSNLLGGGGVERYLKPISGSGKKIQGYFR